jgi:hypothetical protein
LEKYKTAVLGATFYGAAAALKSPQDTVIIERSTLVGREFVTA